MKLLLCSVFFILSFCAFAQNPGNPEIQKQPWTLKNFKGTNNDELRKQFEEYFKHKSFQSNLLANKQGNVLFLPQDRMPCVIPDSSGITLMPNAWNDVAVPYKSQVHPIPNPALPPQSFKYNLNDKSKGKVK